MTTPYSKIPSVFPSLSPSDVNTRRLITASLIRKIAMAQNFLWSRGRVYAAHGYEGNGNYICNKDDDISLETFDDGSGNLVTGLTMLTFLVPQNWNKLNTVKMSYEVEIINGGFTASMHLFAILEDLNGSFLRMVDSGVISAGGATTGSFEMEVPSSGDYQIRILIGNTILTGFGSAGAVAGTIQWKLNHLSARWKEDPDVESTYFEFPTDFFSDDYPVASVFLQKLVKNTLHLWGTRTPHLCQASIQDNYNNTNVFTRVARYVAFVADKVDTMGGHLMVYCTHGGANNEVRVLMDGVVKQTIPALGAGYNPIDLTPWAVTAGEHVFTVEVKSTAAGANWGTMLYGVQLWETGTSLSSPPADYGPVDWNALEGDDFITAQTVNSYGQDVGLRKLFNNDKWLAENRLRVLVGDWLHRTFKRGPRFSYDPTVFDPRVDWTRGSQQVDYQVTRPRNITVAYQSGDESIDALASYVLDGGGKIIPGEADATTGYNESPFSYPVTFTYNGHGARLGLYNIFQIFSGDEVTAGITPFIQSHVRTRRIAPWMLSNDVVGTGPLSDDPAYQHKAIIQTPQGSNYYPRSTSGYDDKKSFWMPSMVVEQQASPYDWYFVGRLYPQELGETPETAGVFKKPEGTLYEIEINSVHVADQPLSETDLQALM